MDIRLIGVAGAGVIGVGVAHQLAAAGLEVLLLDRSDDILAGARRNLEQSVRLQALFRRGQPALDARSILARIRCGTAATLFRDADFVIENITERWPAKEALYRELDAICAPHVIFAANSSVFPVARIAAATRRPTRVIGLHFMNPVPLMTLVEVIRGEQTAPETLDASMALMTRLGKECVVINDSPGYVSNRILMLMVNEAAALVREGVASAEDVDRIFTAGAGHKMGPLATADLIGLDTVVDSLDAMHDLVGDPKYQACPLLREFVSRGFRGCKSGRGFFIYDEPSR